MTIDIAFAVLFLSGFLLGFTRGIVKTLFTILSILFGFLVAVKLSGLITNTLSQATDNYSPYMGIVGFLLAFFGTLLLLRLVGRGVEGFLQTAQINIINKVAGGLLIAAFFSWIFSGVLWFGDETKIITDQTRKHSITYPYLKKFPLQVRETAKKVFPTLEEFWDNSVQMVDDLRDKGIERQEQEPTIIDKKDELE